MNTTRAYALDNHHRVASEHHQALAQLLDAGTRARIAGLAGWPRVRRCLEIGAGAGSMAAWLADQLPTGGLVVACDVKPDLLPKHPRLEPVAHDLTSGVPLVEELDRNYHLILARMTLQHLPNRRRLLSELVGLLAGGGTLLVEDWVLRAPGETVICAPTPEAEQLFVRVRQAMATVFGHAGADPGWARRVYRYMREDGLVDVQTVYSGRYWIGGDPGLRLMATSAAQLRPALLEAGVSQGELDQLVELVDDPQLVVDGHPLYSTSGTKPT